MMKNLKNQTESVWFNKPVFFSMIALTVASTITACSSIGTSKESNGSNYSTPRSVVNSPPVVKKAVQPLEVKKESLGEEFFLTCRQIDNSDRYSCVRKNESWNPFK